MKKLNLKATIAAFSVILVGLTAGALLTFNFADENGGFNRATNTDATVTDASDVILSADAAESITQIDRIIENSALSKSADGTVDPNYYVVEICSDSPVLSSYASGSSNGFTNLVLNGHSTKNETWNTSASIVYKSYTVGQLKAMTTAQLSDVITTVQGADLLYLSGKSYSANNDIPSELITTISKFSIGDYKPMIIDGITGGSDPSGDSSVKITYNTLYKNVLSVRKRYAYVWPTDGSGNLSSANDYLGNNTSVLYLPIDDPKLTKVTSDEGDISYAKILTVTGSNSNITGLLQTGLTPNADNKSGLTLWKVDNTATTPIYHYGYSNTLSNRPQYFVFDSVSINNINSYDDLKDYDAVIFEEVASPAGVTITSEAYKAVKQYEAGRGHIFSNAKLSDTTQTTSTVDVIDTDAKNYGTILDKVSNNGKSTFSNVWVTSNAEISGVISASYKEASDDNFVYIINNGSWRGIGGQGNSTNTYTLLEIEPCYPIDPILEKALSSTITWTEEVTTTEWTYGPYEKLIVDSWWPYEYHYETVTESHNEEVTKTVTQTAPIASKFTNSSRLNYVTGAQSSLGYGPGYYYLDTMNIPSNLTSDEISLDGVNSLTTLREGGSDTVLESIKAGNTPMDYYSWKWSRAKFAKLIGKTYADVNVIHMSSEEFASSKATLLDNYDMIYIGGDDSAYLPVTSWMYTDLGGANPNGFSTVGDFFKKFPAYTMYFTYGNYFHTTTSSSNGDVPWMTSTTAAVVGNDITKNKLSELKEYVDAGMPVVFGKDVCYAFDTYNTSERPTAANVASRIDPNSNMYEFIRYCSNKTSNNIVWDFDFDVTTKVQNSDGTYGNTVEAFATVFGDTASTHTYNPSNGSSGKKSAVNGTTAEELLIAYNGASHRPKYILNKKPNSYSDGKQVTSGSLDFEIEYVAPKSGCTAKLYIDLNQNGVFEESNSDGQKEMVDSTSGTKLSYKVKDDFYGAISYKLIVESEGLTSSYQDVVEIARGSKAKRDINIIQIMNNDAENNGNYQSNSNTIWLDVEAAEAKDILHGNRFATALEGNGTLDIDSSSTQQQILYVKFGNRYESDLSSRAGGLGLTNIPTAGAIAGNVKVRDAVSTTTTDTGISENLNDTTASGEKYGFTYMYYSDANKLGIHVPRFGFSSLENTTIPLINSSSTQPEDWYTNLANNIDDDLNFNVTLMTVSQFNSYSAAVSSAATKYKTELTSPISGSDTDTVVSKLADEYYSFYKYLSDALQGEDVSGQNDKYNLMIAACPQIDGYALKPAEVKPALDGCLDAYVSNSGTYYKGFKNGNSAGSITDAMVTKAITSIKTEQTYYDVYSFIQSNNSNTANNYVVTNNIYGGHSYSYYYNIWRDMVIYKQYFYQKYLWYTALESTLEAGNISYSDTYDVMVLGASPKYLSGWKNGEDFSGDGLTALSNYIDNKKKGKILLFDDTFNAANNGSNLDSLRAKCGFLLTTTGTTSSQKEVDRRGPTYKTIDGGTSDVKGRGFTTYKYGVFDSTQWLNLTQQIDNQFSGADSLDGKSMTRMASSSSTTKGLMKSYPNAISDSIRISPTIVQTYTLDVNNPDMTVWYSLAGGENTQIGSVLAADPNFGAINYYLYTFGNVTYFGAGRQNLLGIDKLNIEERQLIINAIVSATTADPRSAATKLELHSSGYNYNTSKDSTNEKFPLKENTTDGDTYDYSTTTSNDTDYFEFSMIANSDTEGGVTISKIEMYFDLNFNNKSGDESGKYQSTTDKLLLSGTCGKGGDLPWLVSGTPIRVKYDEDRKVGVIYQITYDSDGKEILTKVFEGDGTNNYNITYSGSTEVKTKSNAYFNPTALKLIDEYFAAYNDDYTYFVVHITDSEKNDIYKRIKISKIPYLFKLT